MTARFVIQTDEACFFENPNKMGKGVLESPMV